MASQNLFGAYGASAKASSKYKSSLYDIENVGFEKEARSKRLADDLSDSKRMFGMIGSSLELGKQIKSSLDRKSEISKDIESLGEAKYEKSLKDFTGPTQEPSKSWKELSAKEKLGWTPTQKKSSWFDTKESLYEWEGKEYKQSELLNIAGVKRSETLYDEMGLNPLKWMGKK